MASLFCLFFVVTGDNPLSLDFNPPPFQDGSRLKLPLAVMASNRPFYLLRMLLSLRTVEGLDTSLVTVFIDGFLDEPVSVAKLFGLNVEQHAGSGKLNSRISQVAYHFHESAPNQKPMASRKCREWNLFFRIQDKDKLTLSISNCS